MSSILDALSKLDPEHPTRNATLPLPPPKRRRRRRGPLLGVLFVLAIMVIGALWLRGATPPAPEAAAPVAIAAPVPTPPTGNVAPATPAASDEGAPAATAAAPAALHHLPVVAAVPPPATTASGDRPWIRTDAPPPTPIQPVRATADPTTPPAPPVAAVVPSLPPARGVLVAPKPEAISTPDAMPVAAPPSPTPTLAGVRISFLAYSRIPDLRTVSLAVDGDSLVTLREGEKAGDLEVVRIHPDRVEVKRNGEAFIVPARN